MIYSLTEVIQVFLVNDGLAIVSQINLSSDINVFNFYVLQKNRALNVDHLELEMLELKSLQTGFQSNPSDVC